MNDIPPDSLALTGEQKNDVRRMASLGYAPEDIAAYLGLDASPEIKLHEAAEDGNIDAVKLLTEIQKRRLFENLLKDMDEYE